MSPRTGRPLKQPGNPRTESLTIRIASDELELLNRITDLMNKDLKDEKPLSRTDILIMGLRRLEAEIK